jgi:prepilin-type N-terminal cleavage/methylation domain-containing protein/prepilin-type processing-associated H-X9-DG protein
MKRTAPTETNGSGAGLSQVQAVCVRHGDVVGRADVSAAARKAFTLIELLIVVAVIAVLLAVMLPSLSRCRALAARMKCTNNLKQLWVVWHSYSDAYDGDFYQWPNANLSYGGWRGIKNWWDEKKGGRPWNRYAGFSDLNKVTEDNAELFCCPADRGGIPGGLYRERAYRVNGTSYQTNIFLVGPDGCRAFSAHTKDLDDKISARLPGLNLNRVANPARVLLIGDYGWVGQWRPKQHASPEMKELAEWHLRPDYHNVAFLDGHVRFLEIQKGHYVTTEYCVLPFEDLFSLAREVQGPE